MVICALVILFFAVVASGPSGLEWWERRREQLDAPVARVIYLPSGCCRRGDDPVLKAVRRRRCGCVRVACSVCGPNCA